MENIYTTVKPFYFLAKALGSFPMTFEGPTEKGFLRTKWYDVLFTSCLFFLLTSLAFYKLNGANAIDNDSLIMIKAWDSSLFVGLFVFLVHFWLQIFMRNKIKRFLRSLYNFDQEVKFF